MARFAVLLGASLLAIASAKVYFEETFDTDFAGRWTVNPRFVFPHLSLAHIMKYDGVYMNDAEERVLRPVTRRAPHEFDGCH